MSLNDFSSAKQPAFPDEPSADQRRRFELWRAMSGLSKAQANGALTADQARLIEGLADTLQRLAAQMTELAQLGHRYVELLEAHQQALSAGSDASEECDGEPGSSAVA
jgi:hypothetical protein